MKRLLFIDHAARILGGAEINLIELLAEFVRSGGWELGCACAPGSRLSQALRTLPVRQFDYRLPPALDLWRPTENRSLGLIALPRRRRALREACADLRRVAAEFDPAAVISCTNKDHFVAAAACRATGAAPLWWVNDAFTAEFFSWPVRTMFQWRARRDGAHLVAVSAFARRALAALPDRQVTVIHNGLPLDRYAPAARGRLRGQLGLGDDDRLVGLVGRIAPWKGHRLFLELAARWPSHAPTVRFTIIGAAFNEDQRFEAELRRLAATREPGRRVCFVPFQEDIVPALSDLDVLVHASLRPEPFGRTVIEAMAVGVPVVAARAGGVLEIVTSGEDGLLVEPGSVTAYLEALEALVRTPERGAKLAAQARQTVARRFTVERVRGQFELAIEQAIGVACDSRA